MLSKHTVGRCGRSVADTVEPPFTYGLTAIGKRLGWMFRGEGGEIILYGGVAGRQVNQGITRIAGND